MKAMEKLRQLSEKADNERKAVAALYNRYSAADCFLIGWFNNSRCYIWLRENHEVFSCEIKKSTTSALKGAKKEYRFSTPASVLTLAIENGEAWDIGRQETFLRLKKRFGCHQCGDTLEALAMLYLGKKWKRNSIPFYLAGDVTLPDGRECQCKWAVGGHLASADLLKKLETGALP